MEKTSRIRAWRRSPGRLAHRPCDFHDCAAPVARAQALRADAVAAKAATRSCPWQYVSRSVHVRCRAAARGQQRALCRNLRIEPRTSEARHAEILEHCVRSGRVPRDIGAEEFLRDLPAQFARKSAWSTV